MKFVLKVNPIDIARVYMKGIMKGIGSNIFSLSHVSRRHIIIGKDSYEAHGLMSRSLSKIGGRSL